MLRDLNSPADLMLRGFSRDEVLAATDFDIGYNGRALQADCAGIDRYRYKVRHVIERVDAEVVQDSLVAYSRGASKLEVLNLLGLSGVNIVKLKKLYGDLGYAAEFKEADREARKSNMRCGMVEKYGVDNPFKLEEFQEKAADTREELYGGRYTLSRDSSLEPVARDTLRETLSDPQTAEAVVEKRRSTVKSRYGVDHVSHLPGVKTKMVSTSRDRYGVDHFAQTEESRRDRRDYMVAHADEIASKARETSITIYGVSNHAMLPDRREAQSQTMRDPEHQKRILDAKRENGSFVTSSSEKLLKDLLVSEFGEDDVIEQYRDDRYPWACDFYIPSRDLFIELNGTWTHGGTWFDPEDDWCVDKLSVWESKGTDFYNAAIKQWTVSDVIKRQKARSNNLNYIVFWDGTKLGDHGSARKPLALAMGSSA